VLTIDVDVGAGDVKAIVVKVDLDGMARRSDQDGDRGKAIAEYGWYRASPVGCKSLLQAAAAAKVQVRRRANRALQTFMRFHARQRTAKIPTLADRLRCCENSHSLPLGVPVCLAGLGYAVKTGTQKGK